MLWTIYSGKGEEYHTIVNYEKDVNLERNNHEKGNEIGETKPHCLGSLKGRTTGQQKKNTRR